MAEGFQAEPPCPLPDRPHPRAEAGNSSVRLPPRGFPAWGWFLIALAVLLFLCGGVLGLGAMGWLLYSEDAQRPLPPPPAARPLPPVPVPPAAP